MIAGWFALTFRDGEVQHTFYMAGNQTVDDLYERALALPNSCLSKLAPVFDALADMNADAMKCSGEWFDSTGTEVDDVVALSDFYDCPDLPLDYLRDDSDFNKSEVLVTLSEFKGHRLFSLSAPMDGTIGETKVKMVEHMTLLASQRTPSKRMMTVDDFFLLFDGMELTDDVCLMDCHEAGHPTIDFVVVLKLKGGGVRVKTPQTKKDTQKKDKKEKSMTSKDIRGKAVEVAGTVSNSASLDAISGAHAIMTAFMKLSEEKPDDALVGRLKVLKEENLQGIYDTLCGSSGGGTDYKIRQVSRALCNPELQKVITITLRRAVSLRLLNSRSPPLTTSCWRPTRDTTLES